MTLCIIWTDKAHGVGHGKTIDDAVLDAKLSMDPASSCPDPGAPAKTRPARKRTRKQTKKRAW